MTTDLQKPDADILVIGSGPAGLAAAISARKEGASVILLEMEADIGGHGILSGGNIHLGGGHSIQRALGIEDSPDAIFRDWVRHDHAESRFTDREIVRAYADHSADTFEFLLECGVSFPPDAVAVTFDVNVLGPQSVPRVFRCDEWPDPAGLVAPGQDRNGSGLVRALERHARATGVEIRLRHRMQVIERDETGRPALLGGQGPQGPFRLRAGRGIVIANGGSTGNVAFRRIFDPRLTEEYQQVGGPVSWQTGDGEVAALKLGAQLWATAAQTAGTALVLTRTGHIGCQWGYPHLQIRPDNPHFAKARSGGLKVTDWQDVILVNQLGDRFWNEEDDSTGYFDAALAWTERDDGHNGGGPIWAIFDQDAVEREGWQVVPPHIDPDFFASGETLEELAANIRSPWQRRPIDGARLRAAVERYNGFVAQGEDPDFGKPAPRHAIARAPFYAAWATPMIHDSLSGLRTDTQARVIGLDGAPIPGLYCAGESQGGFSQHGLGRSLVFGRLAGLAAARDPLIK